MEDVLNEIMIFIEDYYVYVVGVGAIIILILIGFLSSKRKARKAPAKVEEVKKFDETGINNIIEAQSSFEAGNIKPIDIAAVSAFGSSMEETPVVEPIVESSPVEEVIAPVEPVFPNYMSLDNDAKIEEEHVESSPVEDVIAPVEPKSDLDNTEVFDFPFVAEAKKEETPVVEAQPFVLDKSPFGNQMSSEPINISNDVNKQ